MKISRRSRSIASFALAFAALVLSACVTVVEQRPGQVPPPPRVALVPSVEGMPLDHARVELERAGYHLGRVSKERDRHAPPGSVLWQDPEPHTRATKGTHVDVVIAVKRRPDVTPPPYFPELTSVPELRGLALRQARRALKRAELRLGNVTEDHARSAPPGTIIWQGPAPSRQVKPGSMVNVVIARAKPNHPAPTTSVPKLRGLSLDEARTRLRQGELRLGQVAEKADNKARNGTVIEQNPRPRQEVRPGTTVDVVVTRHQPNRPIPKTTVPTLRGLSLDEARSRLRQANLHLGQITKTANDNARRGTIVAQTPKPRQAVPRDSLVDVVIVGGQQDRPIAKTTVPKLRGLSLKKARAKLKKAQLRLGEVAEQVDDMARSGTVIAQTPEPKHQVRPGTAVDLVLAAAKAIKQPSR
jgi:serine/threonine-protein kinase